MSGLLLTGGPARAAGPYDPEINWRTIYSPRFAVHYPDHGRNLALRVSRLAEEVLDEVSGVVGFQPSGRTDIVLSDASDLANGSAQVMPKNIVRLYLTAPTELTGLSSYDDWLRILLIHELTHICDLDQTWGLARFLRWVFGKYIQWNGFAPQFLSEGMAVYSETILTSTGRGRSSYVAMLVRMAALEDRFFEIDQAHIEVADWPGPNVAYFYGGIFHLWLAERYGRDAVRRLHQYYASMPVPYLYWFGAMSIFSKSLPELWDEWHAEELEFAQEIEAAVKRDGLTSSRRITFHGRNITGARYDPSGQLIIYSRTSPVDGSTVRQITRSGTDDHYLVLDTFSPRFSFSPDGKSFYFSQNAINERFNNFNDLYRYDLDTGETIRLVDVAHPERSLRARDPAVSPDGRRLVFVQTRLHQSWLSVGEISGDAREQLTVRTLVPPHGDRQQASPCFSPDGRWIAVSTWFSGGFRDIVILDAETGAPVERVTRDAALDGNPAWSPDGRYLLFESDRDGISNLYAFDRRDRTYWRITRVVGGAFQADISADGKWLLFRNATGNGFDIHEMAFAPKTWTSAEPPTDGRSSAPADAPDDWTVAASRVDEAPWPLRENETDEAYSPWGTLLPFQDNWLLLPAVYFYNEDPSITLTTHGQDVLGHHTYALSAGSSWYTRDVNWGAAYYNDLWYPTLSLAGSGQSVSYDAGASEERRLTGSAAVVLPIKQRHVASLSYVRQHRTSSTLGFDPDALGDFSWLELSYRYRFTRRFPYSVGDEHGSSVAIAGRWYPRPLGSDFDELMLTVDGRAYLNNPLFDNHVLALRVAGALAFGPQYREQFDLGGAQGTSIFSVQSEWIYPLRGFPAGRVEYPPGTGVLAGYLEYRFPFWHVERGLWTLPFYLERIHLALFAEGGNTFGNGDESGWYALGEKAWHRMFGGRVGSGMELRADLSLGWAFPLTVRGGLALPVVKHGRLNRTSAWSDRQIYFSFGTAI